MTKGDQRSGRAGVRVRVIERRLATAMTLAMLAVLGCYQSYAEFTDGDRDAEPTPDDARPDARDDGTTPDFGTDVDVDGGRVDDGDVRRDGDARPDADVRPDTDAVRDDGGTTTSVCEPLAPDIIVPRDEATIQGAIDRARDGDLVCVEPGIYHEHLRINEKQIQLVGPAGPFRTIVDGDWADRALQMSGPMGASMVVDGFTLRYGWNAFGGDFWWAGGLTISNGSPTIRHVVVSDNITDSAFGSGVIIQGGESAPSFDNVVILRNEVESGFGAGLWVTDGAHPTVSHAIIAGNWTFSGCGGGVYVEGETASLTLANAIVAANRVESGDGAGLFVGRDGGIGSLVNVTIVGNAGESGEGAGIAIGWSGGTGMLTNVQIIGNADGGISVREPGSAALVSCNLWGNTPEDFGGIPDPIGTAGNISGDPGFLDWSSDDPMRWDLHLSPASSSVDAGAPGVLDPDGSPSDIGAFGGPGAAGWDIDRDGYPLWWQPGPYDPATYPGLGLDCDDLNPDVHPGAGC